MSIMMSPATVVITILTIISSAMSRSTPAVSWPREPPPESMMNQVHFMNSKEIDWEPVEVRVPKQKVIFEKLSTLLHRLKKTNKLKFQENYHSKPSFEEPPKLLRKSDKRPKESEPIIRITITNLEPTGRSFSRRTYKYQ